MHQVLFRAMGSEIFCALDTSHPRAAERLARIPAMFEAWEQTLSRFRPDSELSRLNARPGEHVRVGETLWRVAELARRAETFSDGLVTPALLPALEAAGYDRSFDVLTRAHPGSSAAVPVALAGPPGWELDPVTRSLTLAPGTRLDFGGIAKGWAAERAADYLGELGPAIVDAGGDVVVTAPRSDGSPWVLGIEDPAAPERDNPALPLFGLTGGATATSGRSFRTWTRGGKPMHHILDPRTLQPAETDIVTVTVIAREMWQAETAAKTVFILGRRTGLAWLGAHPALAAVLILQDGSVLSSPGMEHYRV